MLAPTGHAHQAATRTRTLIASRWRGLVVQELFQQMVESSHPHHLRGVATEFKRRSGGISWQGEASKCDLSRGSWSRRSDSNR